MSGPEEIEVDRPGGLVRWGEGKGRVEAAVPGAFDARYDPASGRILVLAREQESGAIVILSRGGQRLGTITAPDGYAISHFVDGGPAVVCQGEAPHEGWWDWHFTVDPRGGEMRRTGPAY